jgi:hypothetical protein
MFPPYALVDVRVPAKIAILALRRGIDLAHYNRREIDSQTARTIAAQLQRGPDSALYAFAVSGTISDRLYEELDEVILGQPPTVRRWVDELARYCLSRPAGTGQTILPRPTAKMCGPAGGHQPTQPRTAAAILN